MAKLVYLGNELSVTNPELVKEWDYDKNYPLTPDDVRVKSNRKVWWKCSVCGHEWQAVISDRSTNHTGCPKRNMKGSSFSEQALFYYFSQAFPDTKNRYLLGKYELDIFVPSENTAVEYDGVYYHRAKKSLEKDNKKDAFCKENGIRLFRIRDAKLPKTNYAEIITCTDANTKALEGSIVQILSILNKSDIAVDLEKDRQQILALYNKTVLENSLAVLRPDYAKEWNYERNFPLTPDKVSCYSNHIVWWKCEKGHEWRNSINGRVGKNGRCPYCCNQKVLEGFNDLATTNPELAAEWDYEKNDKKPTEVTAGSNKSFWWKCAKCGHEWRTKVSHRNSGSGCPVCMLKQSRNTQRLESARKNNLAVKYPLVASEWNYERNEEPPENYACSSNKAVWWICHYCGKEFQARINNKTYNGDRYGCQDCKRKHRNKK